MAFKYEISQEQKAEIELARKKNRNKRIEMKLKVLSLRAEWESLKEISEITEYHFTNVSKIISQFIHRGLSYMLQCHYLGNHRNMTCEQEEAVLAPYLEKAGKGEIVSVAEIAQAYQTAVGHAIAPTQIYAVLKRHDWRKVMPRSHYPKKAREEAIEAPKKINAQVQELKELSTSGNVRPMFQDDVSGRSRLRQDRQAQILLVQKASARTFPAFTSANTAMLTAP